MDLSIVGSADPSSLAGSSLVVGLVFGIIISWAIGFFTRPRIVIPDRDTEHDEEVSS